MAWIWHALCYAFALSSDSFIAGLMIGSIIEHPRERVWFALSFGICDGAASLLGALVPRMAPDLPDLVLYLICVVFFVQGARRNRHWLLAIPVVLGIDNFAAGTPASQAPILALYSMLMAFAGLALGRLGHRPVMRIFSPGAST